MSSDIFDIVTECHKDVDYLNKVTLKAMGLDEQELYRLFNTALLPVSLRSTVWLRELLFISERTILYGKMFEAIRKSHFMNGVGTHLRVTTSTTGLYQHLNHAIKQKHIIKLSFNYGSGRRPIPVYGLNLLTLGKILNYKDGYRKAAAMELQQASEVLSIFGKTQIAINCNGGNKFMKIEDAFGEAVKKSESAKKRRDVRASKRGVGKGSMPDRIDDWMTIHGLEKPIWTGRTRGKLSNLIKDFDGNKEKTYEFVIACFGFWDDIKYRLREDDYIKIEDDPNFERVYNLRDKMKLIVDNKANEKDIWEGLKWDD